MWNSLKGLSLPSLTSSIPGVLPEYADDNNVVVQVSLANSGSVLSFVCLFVFFRVFSCKTTTKFVIYILINVPL